MSTARTRRRSRKRRGFSTVLPAPASAAAPALAPVMEEPCPCACPLPTTHECQCQHRHGQRTRSRTWARPWQWLRAQSAVDDDYAAINADAEQQHSADVRLLLGVLGCPLAPVTVANEPLPHLSIKDVPFETSSAQYIIQQYMAASGCIRFQNWVKSSYMVGRVEMASSECEVASARSTQRYPAKATESGCFVMWQMMPDMWSVELVLAGSKINAASNGSIVWRHTPWLGTHAAKGPPRPLRRALQGLDPRCIAIMFANARCMGERKIGDEDCFILKLAADPSTLQDRSDGPAEIIRHVLFGYFSQKTGLLVQLEDSHLTRIQSTGIDAVYWETTMQTTIRDYRSVDGIMIAHSGTSVVTLFKFGDAAVTHTRTTMKESWTIDDVVFNVPGLSSECFIPPAEIVQGKTTLHHPQKSSSFSYSCNTKSKSAIPGNDVMKPKFMDR